MKLTNQQLEMISDQAKRAYRNLAPQGLSTGQFMAKCYTEAILEVLQPGIQIEYQKPVHTEPTEE